MRTDSMEISLEEWFEDRGVGMATTSITTDVVRRDQMNQDRPVYLRASDARNLNSKTPEFP